MPKEITILQCMRRQEKGADEEEPPRHSCTCPCCPLRCDRNVSKSNSTTERISTELLIDAVKRRPVLWSPEHLDHAKREERQRVWTEVVDEFYGTDVKQDEKSYLSMLLQERWRNLKWCFSRELTRKRRIELGLGANDCKAEYPYYKQLHFLKDAVNSQTDVNQQISHEETNHQLDNTRSAYDMIYNPREDTITHTEESQPRKIHFEPKKGVDGAKSKIKPNPEKLKGESRKKADDNFVPRAETKIEKVRSEPLENADNFRYQNDDYCEHGPCPENLNPNEKINDLDEDKLFLLSLLKPLKAVSKSYKLPTKMKLMEIIHKAQEESGIFSVEKTRR